VEWHELRDEVRDIWSENAAFWDEKMGEAGNDFFQWLVAPSAERLLELQPGWTVLEIACGNGIFSRRMAAQGVNVVATDVSDAMIEIAKSRPVSGSGNVTYHVIDAADYEALLALGEGRFDAAVCNMAIMDMPVIDPLFAALGKLLKPGGRFVFTLMHPCFNSAGLTRVTEETDEGGVLRTIHSVKVNQYHTPVTHVGLAIVGQPKPQHYFHRSLSDLLGRCFRAGFALNGLEEPVFPATDDPEKARAWAKFSEIPPVLAARLCWMATAEH